MIGILEVQSTSSLCVSFQELETFLELRQY